MADDWQVGDLALCVDDKNLRKGLVRKGGLYRVNDLFHGDHVKLGPRVSLFFDGINDIMGYAAIRFRKIRPLRSDERSSFLADLNEPVKRSRETVSQAPTF